MRLVILECPFSAPTDILRANVLNYARACLRDCLNRDESPIASHLLYTQPGVLDDDVPEERNKGIVAGLAWLDVADASVVYTDLGISKGMQEGIRTAQEKNKIIEYRKLPKPLLTDEEKQAEYIIKRTKWVEEHQHVNIKAKDAKS